MNLLKQPLNKKINQATCLILDKRIDNASNILSSAQKNNIDVDFFIAGDGLMNLEYNHIDTKEPIPFYQNSIQYASWYNRPNAYNAWLCHRKIIKRSLEKKQDYLFILEDDIIFELDFLEILEKVTPFFYNNEWDMIYFGWYSHNHLKNTEHENIYRMIGGGGFHGVLLNSKIMKIIVDFLPLGPYDWMCGQFIHKDFNCYAIYPSIISQTSGYSYVEDGHLEKPDRKQK